MSSQDHRDTLDSLLDSLSEDQEIEKKMDDFARNKERAERIARARQTSRQFQQTYSSSARRAAKDQYPKNETLPQDDGEMIYSPDEEGDVRTDSFTDHTPSYSRYENSGGQSAGGMTREFPGSSALGDRSAGGGTRVFNTVPAADPSGEMGDNDVDQTRQVRVGSDEIASLLDQDEPILRREYIRDDQAPYDDYDDRELFKSRPAAPRRRPTGGSSPTNWRLIGIVAGIALALVLIGGAGYMIYSYMNTQQVQQDSEGFQTVMDWIEKYPSYSDGQKKDILSLKKTYDRLSEDEKRKVNEMLLSMTGKTFDELLADANSQEKPSSSNSDVANAERKAKLREQIDQLTGEINTLNGQLDATNKRISDAKANYDSKNEAANQAEADRDSAQGEVDSINASITQLQGTIDSLNQQINDATVNLPVYPGADDDDDDDDDDKKDSHKPSVAPQVPTVNIDALKSQLADAERQMSDLQNQLSAAEGRLDSARQAATAARSEADTAYGAWQEIANDATPIQNDINQKMAQLSALQDEYNSIK